MCVSVWDNVCVESSVSAWDFSSHFYEPICRQGLKPQALDSPHCCATPALKRLWVVPVRLAHHTHAHTARFASCSHSVWNTCINNHELRTFPCMTCKLYVHTHTQMPQKKVCFFLSFFFFKHLAGFVLGVKRALLSTVNWCAATLALSHIYTMWEFLLFLSTMVYVLSLSVFLSFIFSSSLHGRFIGLNSSHSITQQNAVMAIQAHI